MKRWAVCKLVPIDGMIEPAISRHTDTYRVWSAGQSNWCMVKFSILDLTPANNDPDCFVLPDSTLDAAWSSLPVNVRNAVKTKLQAFGITDTSAIQNSWTIRQVLVWLGQKLQPYMNPEDDDIQDVV